MTADNHASDVAHRLSEQGYWPARAAEYLAEKKYADTVRLCKSRLEQEPELISGRLLYARALYHSGQFEAADEQFHAVLARDPNNIVAIKYLGDIRFKDGEHLAAESYYRRVLEIDPHCGGLVCKVDLQPKETTRTVMLKRTPELTRDSNKGNLRQIPFVTETIGDLYLAQGHTRLAAEVFEQLMAVRPNPRLSEKLDRAKQRVRDKE